MLGIISLLGGVVMGGIFLSKVCDKEPDWGWALTVTILLCIITYLSWSC